MLLIGFEERCKQRGKLGRTPSEGLFASLVDERNRSRLRKKIPLDSRERIGFEPYGSRTVPRKHGSVRKQREGFGLFDQARRSRDLAIPLEHFDRLALAPPQLVLARRLRQRLARNARDERARSRGRLQKAFGVLLAVTAQGCRRNELALHGIHERAPIAEQLPQVGCPRRKRNHVDAERHALGPGFLEADRLVVGGHDDNGPRAFREGAKSVFERSLVGCRSIRCIGSDESHAAIIPKYGAQAHARLLPSQGRQTTGRTMPGAEARKGNDWTASMLHATAQSQPTATRAQPDDCLNA